MQDSVQLQLHIVYPPFQSSTTVTLALADYWILYWIASRLTSHELHLLYSLENITYADPAEPFPIAARYALLRALQAPTPPPNSEAALEMYTYDLLSHAVINYQEATALASEMLNKRIQVDAWAKRISRYADRTQRPRLDGRKTKPNGNVQQEHHYAWHTEGVTITVSRLQQHPR